MHRYANDTVLFEESNILVKDDFGKTKEEAILKFLQKYKIGKNKNLCAIVGDLGGDIIAGKNMGITSIAMTTGYATKKLLLEAKPDGIFDSVQEFAQNVIEGSS